VTEPIDTSGRSEEDRPPGRPRAETPPALPASLPREEQHELPPGEETNGDADMLGFCSDACTSLDSSSIPASSVPWWHNSTEALALVEQHEGHNTACRDKSVVTEVVVNAPAAIAKNSEANDTTGTDGVLCTSSRDSSSISNGSSSSSSSSRKGTEAHGFVKAANSGSKKTAANKFGESSLRGKEASSCDKEAAKEATREEIYYTQASGLVALLGCWRDGKGSRYTVTVDNNDSGNSCSVKTVRPDGRVRMTKALIRAGPARGRNLGVFFGAAPSPLRFPRVVQRRLGGYLLGAENRSSGFETKTLSGLPSTSSSAHDLMPTREAAAIQMRGATVY